MPRGFPQARSRTLPGGVIYSVDYLAPIALLDQPLLLGWALTGAGVGLHVEGIADFSLPSPTATSSPAVYVGADLALRFTYGSYSVPLGAGIAAAVSTAHPSVFDPSRDLGVYVYVGFDSLGSPGAASSLMGGARADRGGASKIVLFPGG